MILLCNLVKACLKFFNMRGYTDLMKFIVWARTMLFCEAITRPASRLLWNTAASRFLTSPDSASGHLKAQRQILNHNSQVTVLRQSFSKLQVYCMNSPRAALTHYSFTCKGKKKKSLISETHTEVSFIAYDPHVSCSCPCAPHRHQKIVNIPYTLITAQQKHTFSHCTKHVMKSQHTFLQVL